MILRAQSKMRIALPSLQKEYFWGLLQGKTMTGQQLRDAFTEIDIPLDASLPVYLLIGRIDAWKEMFTAPDKALLAYAFQNIGDEYLSAHVRYFSVVFDMLSNRFHAMKYGLMQGHGLFHEAIMTDQDLLKWIFERPAPKPCTKVNKCIWNVINDLF